MATPVEVSVTNTNERGVFLTVRDIVSSEVLAVGLTADEVIQHSDWRVCGVVHPTDVDETAFINPRNSFDALVAMQKEISELRCEEGMATRDRYRELQDPDGPLRSRERNITVLRLVAIVSIKAMTGVWPSQLRDIGVN